MTLTIGSEGVVEQLIIGGGGVKELRSQHFLWRINVDVKGYE